jgi:hypothetical protein
VTAEGPHVAVAADFMARKGYPKAVPVRVDRVEARHQWYFDYDLPEGRLELEVLWTEADGWTVSVWDFRLWD